MFNSIFLVIVGFLFQPLRIRIQTTADKLILRGKYDYYNTMAEVSAGMTEIMSMGGLVGVIKKALFDVMEISRVRILLPDNFGSKGELSKRLVTWEPEEDVVADMRSQNAAASESKGPALLADEHTGGLRARHTMEAELLADKSPLVKYALRKRQVIVQEEIRERIGMNPRVFSKLFSWFRPSSDSANEEDKGFLSIVLDEMRGYNITVAVPCMLRGRLIGLFLLGDKLTGDPYTEEDLRLLRTLGSQSAIAFENTRTYEEIFDELRRTREQAERTTRLVSLGTLAMGLAHEIRNPMAVMSSQAELLPKRLDNPEFLKRFSEMIPKHVFRIVNITNKILKFGEQKTKELVDVNVNQLVEETALLFEGEAKKKRVEFIKELGDIPVIKADPDGLTEVLLNLCLNSIQAMGEDGGKLTVKTARAKADVKSGEPVDCVQISVIDTGCGIPKDKIEEIFNPFFTTKHEGTGLGLATSHKNIESMGGTIEVESEVGKGSIFRVNLPK